jgi:hypothetical protein
MGQKSLLGGRKSTVHGGTTSPKVVWDTRSRTEKE